MCSLEDEELHCRAVAVGFNASVVNVDYRKAPENPYDIQLLKFA
jgi:acetyl esterase/lipase